MKNVFWSLLACLVVCVIYTKGECENLCTIHTSHAVELVYQQESSESQETGENIHLDVGRNEICMEHPGKYIFTPVNACYKFNHGETITCDSINNAEIKLVATQFAVIGKIAAPERIKQEDVTVTIESDSSHVMPVMRVGRFFLGYQYWANDGETLTITPKSEGDLLFYPETQEIAIMAPDKCVVPEFFISRPGLFLKGVIEPALVNVDILVYEKEGSEILTQTVTNERGEYSVGPLRDNLEYDVRPQLLGYSFNRRDSGVDFAATKLNSIEDNSEENIDLIL